MADATEPKVETETTPAAPAAPPAPAPKPAPRSAPPVPRTVASASRPAPAAKPAPAAREIPAAKEAAAVANTPGGEVWATGRRKSSVARVRVRRGGGAITVNKRPYATYFCLLQDRARVEAALALVSAKEKVDVIVTVKGGGPTGQAGAIAMGLARALRKYDAAYSEPLRTSGLLTRDSRMKERKKYGRRGARRGFQFSKR